MSDHVAERSEMTALAATIRAEVAKVFVGQDEILGTVLAALIAGGHVLIEGVPGLGKTLLVRALARAISGATNRVQFTPDLMPSDITGHIMWDAQARSFETRKGPVFTNLLIADEINRAPAKTQAALFEAMQERQVSIDGTTHELPSPFVTLATQNPYEHEGTYPLPDAQKDRFLMKLLIGYPHGENERRIVRQATDERWTEGLDVSEVQPVCTLDQFIALQRCAARVQTDDTVIDYAVRIVEATRTHHALSDGAGPRAGIALVRCARAVALIDDRDFIEPDDILALSSPVLRHRVRLSPESEIGGLSADAIVRQIVGRVEAPRR